jgi:Ca-activated chloride channel family protein
VVLLAFSGETEPPVQVAFDSQAIDSARAKVLSYADALESKGGTGIYSALLQAESMAASEHAAGADRYVSIVLLTDGENTTGPDLSDFKSRLGGTVPARVFPILFGEASNADMSELAAFTGGRTFDGRKAALSLVFKEIRGYQ